MRTVLDRVKSEYQLLKDFVSDWMDDDMFWVGLVIGIVLGILLAMGAAAVIEFCNNYVFHD